jgi:hypothetical protein
MVIGRVLLGLFFSNIGEKPTIEFIFINLFRVALLEICTDSIEILTNFGLFF